ncbi:PrsW family intramembrane metalloprotease [Arcanobacterium phocae]|uniref:PrsW family intramembrane metalloprotease n=1 Tax=Arcanobacterium phocae TaxID=131112 RepID=UPI001C0EE859|nr:PrsW family intramembrane metalloprotease [Arcanobacterium phocae]
MNSVRVLTALKEHSLDFYAHLIGLGILAILALLELLPVLAEPAGISAAVVAAVWALVPVIFTLILVWLVDYWEPEPLWLYSFAFLWGSGVSVILGASINDFASSRLIPSLLADGATVYDVSRYTASWVAPISEEIVKGLGIVVIYVVFRKYFNGPVDGIVYGALIGAGFGFTENILYFVRNFDYLAEVFTVRFLDGPLSHDTYSALFGFCIGFAEYSRRRWALFAWTFPALAVSGLFHFINNDALNWDGMTYEKYKIVTNVPLAVVAIIMVFYARRYEKIAVLGGLEPYVRLGWFARHEVVMISRIRYRQQAVVWAENRALKLGAPVGAGAQAMRRFQKIMLQIGHETTRAQRSNQHVNEKDRAYLSSLLAKSQTIRQVFTA